jgi:hypothetical protein
MSDHTIHVDASSTCNITCAEKVYGKPGHNFEWICDDGELEINFNKKGTPFSNGSVFQGTKGKATKPKAKVKGKNVEGCYDYSIKVTLPDGTVCDKDPQIIIDETNRYWYEWTQDTMWALGAVVGGAVMVVWGVKKLLRLKAPKRLQIDRKM